MFKWCKHMKEQSLWLSLSTAGVTSHTFRSKKLNVMEEESRVNPENMSQKCSGCVNVKDALSFSQREYSFTNFDLNIDRDLKAVITISRIAKSGRNLPS